MPCTPMWRSGWGQSLRHIHTVGGASHSDMCTQWVGPVTQTCTHSGWGQSLRHIHTVGGASHSDTYTQWVGPVTQTCTHSGWGQSLRHVHTVGGASHSDMYTQWVGPVTQTCTHSGWGCRVLVRSSPQQVLAVLLLPLSAVTLHCDYTSVHSFSCGVVQRDHMCVWYRVERPTQ